MHAKLNNWTAQFASPESEKAYQAFVAERDQQNNSLVLLVGLPIFALYSVLDIGTLEVWKGAVLLRSAAVVLCFALLLSLRADLFSKKHELITMIAVVILGLTINMIIYKYAALKHSYYVGLVQGCVFTCFLLRISFIKSVLAMTSFLAVFTAIVYAKAMVGEAYLQVIVLTTMVIVCAIGSYMFQRFRRNDFQKALIIDNQNQQLNVLLDDVRRDHERKLAAMNMLVHFVKTPLHQINGFSEILMSGLVGEENTTPDDGCVESARYIKDATTNLSNSVNRLLTYHRLDEIERQNEFDNVSIDEQLCDFSDMLDSDISIKIEGSAGAVNTVPVAVKTLFESLSTFYNDIAREAPSLDIVLSVEANAAAWVIIRDNCAALTPEEFLEDTKPLTKIDNYLTSAGSEMPMMLRTVARAAELIGGRFEHEPLADGNVFKIRFLHDSLTSRVEPMSGLKPALAG